jgi:hypothetical protein
VNPGEVWRFEDNTRRLVLSHAMYNASALARVISCVVGDPPRTFDPFAVTTPAGTVYVDRLAMHPRHWLVEPVARIDDRAHAAVRGHLAFLFGARTSGGAG